jgi:hypothetical protein
VVTLVSISCIFKVFIRGAVAFIGKGGTVIFIDKGSLAVGERLSKAARAGVVDDIKGVDRRNLRQQLMMYKLKSPLVLMNSLISASDYSIKLSLWAILYSTCSTDLLFLLKTHTLLYWSSCLSPLIIDLSASLNIYTLKLLKSF